MPLGVSSFTTVIKCEPGVGFCLTMAIRKPSPIEEHPTHTCCVNNEFFKILHFYPTPFFLSSPFVSLACLITHQDQLACVALLCSLVAIFCARVSSGQLANHKGVQLFQCSTTNVVGEGEEREAK